MSEIFCLGRPCPSSLLHVAISSDTDEFVRGCAMRMLKAACSRGHCCRLPKWPWPRMISDLSLRCSLNKILSGSRTRTRARMLGQCKCKCTLNYNMTCVDFAVFTKIIRHIWHFRWLGPNVRWDFTNLNRIQYIVNIKPIGQMSDEPWKFFGYTDFGGKWHQIFHSSGLNKAL